MTNMPKATLVVASALAATVFGLAACSKAPSGSGAASQAAGNVGSSAHPVAAALSEPPVPDANRTDAEAVAMRDAYVKWVKEKARPAGLQRPVPPDPRNTDPVSKAVWAKYALWRVAEREIDDKRALALLAQQTGVDKPQSKATYGRMAEGLPHLSSGQK